MKKKQAGFTLIELMVVIAIIAILTAMGIGGYSSSMRKARDARRKSDIQALSQALTLYRMDWSYYPSPNDPNGEYFSSEIEWADGNQKYHGFKPYLSQLSAYFDPRSKTFDLSFSQDTENVPYSYFCLPSSSSPRCKSYMICAKLESKDGGNLDIGVGSESNLIEGWGDSMNSGAKWENIIGTIVGKSSNSGTDQWYCAQSS